MALLCITTAIILLMLLYCGWAIAAEKIRRRGGADMETQQYVMAYKVEQDRLRAMLPRCGWCCASMRRSGAVRWGMWS